MNPNNINLIVIVPLLQIVFAQTTFFGQMIDQMRFTHSEMAKDIDVIQQLIKPIILKKHLRY